MKRILIVAVLVLALVPGTALATAHVSKAQAHHVTKKHKKHRKHKPPVATPTPPVEYPHGVVTFEVSSPITQVCTTGFGREDCPLIAEAHAECPAPPDHRPGSHHGPREAA